MSHTAPVTEPWILEPGALVGDKYEITERIGRDGFSELYSARDQAGRPVMLKLMRPEHLNKSALRAWRENQGHLQAVDQLALVQDFLGQYAEHQGQSFVYIAMDGVPSLQPSSAMEQRKEEPSLPSTAELPPARPPLALERRLERLRRQRELIKAQRTFWVVVAVLSAYGLGAATSYSLALVDALPVWPF